MYVQMRVCVFSVCVCVCVPTKSKLITLEYCL